MPSTLKSYPRSLPRPHTHETIPLGDLSGALDRSGMEVNFCAATDAVMSATGNRRPRGGEIPCVWSNPLVKVAAPNSRQRLTAGRAKCPFFETFTFAALRSLRPMP